MSPHPAAPQGAAGVAALCEALAGQLSEAGTPARADAERRYLKSNLTFYGVPVPGIRAAVRTMIRNAGALKRTEVLDLVEQLWDTKVHELRMSAVFVLERYVEVLHPEDIEVVERLLRESRTWALVDPLATHTAAVLVAGTSDPDALIWRWVSDDDFWIRRAALLLHLGPLRKGTGDFQRFAAIADALVDEREFFIRKAIGWVLREHGRIAPDNVAAWLAVRTDRVSGVTIREAVKYLSPEQREALLQAYRERRPAV